MKYSRARVVSARSFTQIKRRRAFAFRSKRRRKVKSSAGAVENQNIAGELASFMQREVRNAPVRQSAFEIGDERHAASLVGQRLRQSQSRGQSPAYSVSFGNFRFIKYVSIGRIDDDAIHSTYPCDPASMNRSAHLASGKRLAEISRIDWMAGTA